MFYGAAAWDPWLIVAQIVFLQCLYYLSLGLFLSILVGPRVAKMSLVYFFDFATVTASAATGWCVIASIFLSSTAGAGVLVYLVERARKCLDFSATLYIIHLFICLLYGGWPSTVTWWVVNIAGLAVMAMNYATFQLEDTDQMSDARQDDELREATLLPARLLLFSNGAL